jgi:hypothetical protein
MRSLVLAVLLVAAGSALAQVPFMPEFGVRAGVNISDINTDDLDSSTRSGYVAGLYLDLATPLLHLQPEALLTSKGFKGGSVGVGGRQLEYRNISLEVPILLVFSLPVPVVSPRAYAGPAFSLPLRNEMKLKDDWIDIKDDTQSTWSLILGAGVKLGKFGVDLRYDVGMTEVNERPMGAIINDAFEEVTGDNQYKDIKERTWVATVSFALN